MSEPISAQRAVELIKLKQTRSRKKVTPVQVPEHLHIELVVKYSWSRAEWVVKKGVEVLFSADTELECRQERERLEDERA